MKCNGTAASLKRYTNDDDKAPFLNPYEDHENDILSKLSYRMCSPPRLLSYFSLAYYLLGFTFFRCFHVTFSKSSLFSHAKGFRT